jgi:hypothetical protein
VRLHDADMMRKLHQKLAWNDAKTASKNVARVAFKNVARVAFKKCCAFDIEASFMIKHPNVPTKLYKYRSFLDSHKSALENEVLYMCSPDRFNDPYDTAIYFDPDRFLIEDYTLAEFQDMIAELRAASAHGEAWRPKPIRKPVRQKEWQDRVSGEILKNEPKERAIILLQILDEIDRERTRSSVERVSNWLRAGFGVLSLSANPNSVLMWSHYSDSHKGFCIEYDFGVLTYADLRKRLCHPVFYRKKITDATRWLAHTDMADFNNLFGQFICLIKSDEWQYEKEWRIVHAIGPAHANTEIRMPQPSSILLGVHVSRGPRLDAGFLHRTWNSSQENDSTSQ